MPVVLAQETIPNYFVYGTVYKSSGAPVPAGITVHITDIDISKTVTDDTDAAGHYQRDIGPFAIPGVAIGHHFIVNAMYKGEKGSCSFVFDPVANISQRCDIQLKASATTEERAGSTTGGEGVYRPPVTMNVPVDPTTGKVTSTTTLITEKATLTIPQGIIVKDAAGNPLSTPITALYTPSTAKTVGAITAYDFGPSGTTFSPPIDLVIGYDPADIPAGHSESDLVIRMWDGTAWIDLPTTVDTVAHTATAKVSHFTIFALFAAPPVAPPPTPTPSPSPTPTPAITPTIPPVTPTPPVVPPKIPWALIIGIIIAVIVVGAAAYYFYTKRKA